MVVDALIDALIEIIMGFLSGIGVAVLTDANVNVFASEVAVPAPLEGFCGRAAFECRPMADLDCGSVLQDRMPSYHV